MSGGGNEVGRGVGGGEGGPKQGSQHTPDRSVIKSRGKVWGEVNPDGTTTGIKTRSEKGSSGKAIKLQVLKKPVVGQRHKKGGD